MRSPIQVNCLGSKHIYMNNINGVVVKGDESSGNNDWYGVIKKIIALDFPQGKEYGIIDIDKTRLMNPQNLQTRTIILLQHKECSIDSLSKENFNINFVLLVLLFLCTCFCFLLRI
ncbi:hypothetical protein ACJX0J_041880 [Zea mays]